MELGEYNNSLGEDWQKPLFRLRIFAALTSLVFGLGLFCYGLVNKTDPSLSFGNDNRFSINQDEILIETAKMEKEDGQEKPVFVDLSGAVKKPAVYCLPGSSKVADALRLAGGLLPEADRLWVAQKLNLAESLTDGQKIYIPFIGEQSIEESATQLSTHPQATDEQLININTATKSELESLTGVGPARSEAIIKGRPYTDPIELLDQKILGEKTFAKIKDQLTTNN